ncbi:MAG: electron transfer flavoprotein subunit alpha/FixB family protein [Deltaproteobacteria bacterium]|nr:MAG: electron transfer flavoprotein subunit alpha/FixB family protein [Deltaproteobacteria bacterium]
MSIIVFAEQRGGALRKITFEVISEGKRLAAAAGDSLKVLLAGDNVSGLAEELKKFGPDEIAVANSDQLADYTTESYAGVLADYIKQENPSLVLLGHSAIGKDLAPRVAARLGAGLVSDCIKINVDGGDFSFVHPIYAGKAIATYKVNSAVKMATLRPNVFPIEEAEGAASVVDFAPEIAASRTKVKEVIQQAGDRPELTEADIICSGGRGLGGPDGFGLIEELADTLGAAVGSSRAAVDAGWRDHQAQVGQTGKVVSPNLYIACGISGAIQHLAGMGSSKCIVGINKDPEANIFNVADYGIEGDLYKVVPALIEKLKEVNG